MSLRIQIWLATTPPPAFLSAALGTSLSLMLLFDASHTSHTRAQTGIQRVVRSMYAALAAQGPVAPVCFDPHQGNWRHLEAWEQTILTDTTGAGSAHRSARWPLRVRLRGYANRLRGHRSVMPAGDSLVSPELFSAKVFRSYPALFSSVRGPRVAIFHDAIALKYPELTPAKTVSRFPAYLQDLLAFDGIAAVSEDSRQCLIDYWRWLGIAKTPPVIAIPLAVEIHGATSPSLSHPLPAKATGQPVILSVGSLEGRKNHLALLSACEHLWAQGMSFRLRLIGLAHPQTGRAALEKIRALQAAGYPLSYDGPVDEATLAVAYAKCAFTVYPSLMEGFGLPVQESLAHGKPSICSSRGALGESARGGGCVALDKLDAPQLAEAIKNWLASPAMLADAAAAARLRQMKPWATYAQELVSWMTTLARRGQQT